MVHNGVIFNDLEVASIQKERGVKYVSQQDNGQFNDSEVLLYDLASYIEGKTDELQSQGSIAFIIIQLDKLGNREALYFGRNSGSPLIIKKYENGFSLTSEGDGILIETNKLFKFDYKTNKFSECPITIPYTSKYYGYTKTDYEYDWKSYYDSETYQYEEKYAGSGWKKIGDCWYSEYSEKGYDIYGNKIDINGYLLPDKTGVFTERVLQKYSAQFNSCDFDSEEYDTAIKEVKGALLYDMNFATDEAVAFAGYMIEELESESEALETLIKSDEVDACDFDTYCEVETKITMLKDSVMALNKGQLMLDIKSKYKDLTV